MDIIRKHLTSLDTSIYKQQILSYDELKQKIQSILVSSDNNKFDIDTFNDYVNQKKLEHCLSKPVNQTFLDFILYLNDVINRRYDMKNSYYLNAWTEAYIEFIKGRKETTANNRLFELENLLVKSINYFKKYPIKTLNGNVVINNTIKQISNEINKQIIDVGAENLLTDIFTKQLKRNSYKRFDMPKKVSMIGFKELAIPYNYLITLAIKNTPFNSSKKIPFNQEKIEELYITAKHFLALFQLQDFFVFSAMTLANFSLKDLHRQLSYDNVFRFNQMSDDNIKNIFYNLFQNIDDADMNKKLGFTLKEYLDLIKKIMSLSPNAGLIYLLFDMFTAQEIKVLDMISHQTKVNTKYILPDDIQSISFYDKPLIKCENYYLLIDLNYCSWLFYEVLVELLSEKKVSITRTNTNHINGNIGFNIEDYLIKEFENKNINIHYGNYSNDNECDIVVEDKESNTLVFLEIKKKNFTKESRSGDLNFVALDFVESFVYAMNQAYRHEYNLETKGKIKFLDGTQTEIIFNNQKIERVAVTLYDFQSLTQNSMALIEWFSQLVFTIKPEFVPANYQERRVIEKFKKANKQLDQLRKNLQLISSLEKDYRERRMNTKLVSLEYILFILQYVDEDTSFYQALTFNKHIVSGSADLYSEYLSYKREC